MLEQWPWAGLGDAWMHSCAWCYQLCEHDREGEESSSWLKAYWISSHVPGTHEVCYANQFKACLSAMSVERSVVFFTQDPLSRVNTPCAAVLNFYIPNLSWLERNLWHNNLMMMCVFVWENSGEYHIQSCVSPPLHTPVLRGGGGPSSLEGHVWTETLSRVPDIQISVTDVPLRFDANEGN